MYTLYGSMIKINVTHLLTVQFLYLIYLEIWTINFFLSRSCANSEQPKWKCDKAHKALQLEQKRKARDKGPHYTLSRNPETSLSVPGHVSPPPPQPNSLTATRGTAGLTASQVDGVKPGGRAVHSLMTHSWQMFRKRTECGLVKSAKERIA